MATGVNSIMHMGIGALFASQANIQTTGNNISNVNTPGYSRQSVRLEEQTSLDYYPGQMGQGVVAAEVYRHFDRFIESAYLDRSAMQSRYSQEYSLLRSAETIFNETGDLKGISNAISAMFDAWNDLATEPDSQANRVALQETVSTLSAAVRSADAQLKELQEKMDKMISQDVDRANQLIKEIAELNREINIHTIEGRNNANAMLDTRDQKVRELSTILDIKVDDKGAGRYMVTTGSGMLLVQEDIPYSLEFRGPRVENNLVSTSTYNGTVEFSGQDGYEYTVEVTKGGTIDRTGMVPPAPGTAEYRISLDGGKTWIMDEATGRPKVFYATDNAHSTSVKNLDISFTNPSTGPAGTLSTGDKFLLTPKSDVYWISPTAGPIDISTQVYQDGTDNNLRITGGSLAGYLDFRDNKIAQYRDRLQALTDAVTWEVNRIHSQGMGLEPLSHALGTYTVGRTGVPLGSPSSGLHWAGRLTSGNMTFAVFDPETGKPMNFSNDPDLTENGLNVFSPENFDPSKHTLQDVVNAINSAPTGQFMEATIVDNRLQITAKTNASGEPYKFTITSDTTGLAAALGINTFFAGTTPSTFAIRDELAANTNMINAARLNGGAEGNLGDNITAREIAALATKDIKIAIPGRSSTTQTIGEFYGATVTKVGADTQSVGFLSASESTMANELKSRQDEISGVNLDEEMSNLIKFQASYKAAAKLITTADQMLQTLLSLKQ